MVGDAGGVGMCAELLLVGILALGSVTGPRSDDRGFWPILEDVLTFSALSRRHSNYLSRSRRLS
jgi:hypothetical protein